MRLASILAAALLSSAALAQDKERTLEQLSVIGGQLEQLKVAGQTDSPQWSQLFSQYQSLAAGLGGDDPAGIFSHADVTHGTQRIAPPAPPGGTATTTTFTDNMMVAIPDNDMTSVTISVTGVDTFLFDLDLTTDITHTFAGDLDITLSSPAGTTTVITTDNGGGNDDVFSGTLWDDQGGNAATDFVYTDAVTATPLIPEGALGAFFGEDPNGTWTLSVADDAGADTGNLNSWALDITTLAPPTTTGPTNFSDNTAQAIPDNDPAGVSATLTVSGVDTYLCGMTLTTDITHTFAGDLDITLASPSGTNTVITTDNGGGNDNVFSGTLWMDNAIPASDFVYTDLVTATPLAPEGAFSAFIGDDPNGVWTLTVADDAGADTGNLNSWSLDITTCTAGTVAPPLAPAAAIPTLSTYALILLALLMLVATLLSTRRYLAK